MLICLASLFYQPTVTLENKENVGRMNFDRLLVPDLYFFLMTIIVNRYRSYCYKSLEKQNKITTQYALDTTIRNQTQDEEKHNTTQHKERLLSTAFIAEEKVTRWVLLLEQELLTLLEHLSSLPVFSGNIA
jgi:hypothetical protein